FELALTQRLDLDQILPGVRFGCSRDELGQETLNVAWSYPAHRGCLQQLRHRRSLIYKDTDVPLWLRQPQGALQRDKRSPRIAAIGRSFGEKSIMNSGWAEPSRSSAPSRSPRAS